MGKGGGGASFPRDPEGDDLDISDGKLVLLGSGGGEGGGGNVKLGVRGRRVVRVANLHMKRARGPVRGLGIAEQCKLQKHRIAEL